MAGYDGRGARFPLTIVRGADFAIALTVTSGGVAVNLSAATISGEVYTAAGTLFDTMTATVSGASSNIVTLSFTDAETALLVDSSYRWTLWVTRSGDKRPWLAGQVSMSDGTTGQNGTAGAYSVTVDEDVTLSIEVAYVGAIASEVTIADTAGNYTATTVEGALAELPERYAPLPPVVGTAGQVLAIDTADPLVTEWVTGGGGAVDSVNGVTGVVVLDAGDILAPVSAQTAAYTLVLADAGKAVEVTSATPVDVTVPPNASVAFDVGTVIEVAQMGAGQVSIVADSGVTVNSRGGLLDIAGQYGAVSLRKQATNAWLLVGDLV